MWQAGGQGHGFGDGSERPQVLDAYVLPNAHICNHIAYIASDGFWPLFYSKHIYCILLHIIVYNESTCYIYIISYFAYYVYCAYSAYICIKGIFSIYYICCIYMYVVPYYYFVLPQEQAEKCCGSRGGGGCCCCGACRAAGQANPHELEINEECTRTCCCRACWNGTETA